MDRSAGGVIIVFAGVVLLIAAVKGSLKNVWSAMFTPDTAGAVDPGAQPTQVAGSPVQTAPTGATLDPGQGPSSFTGGGGTIANVGGGRGVPAGWPGSTSTNESPGPGFVHQVFGLGSTLSSGWLNPQTGEWRPDPGSGQTLPTGNPLPPDPGLIPAGWPGSGQTTG